MLAEKLVSGSVLGSYSLVVVPEFVKYGGGRGADVILFQRCFGVCAQGTEDGNSAVLCCLASVDAVLVAAAADLAARGG